MSFKELVVMIAMCSVWGLHFVVIKVAVDAVPPLFYAGIRMILVAALLAPLLRWRRGKMAKVIVAGLCLGCFNYAFMFNGVQLATASSSAIAMELYVPFATILSVLFLQEKVGWRRIFGISLAFAGVLIIALGKHGDVPGDQQRLGVALVAAGAFTEAIGVILIKQTSGFKPLELLAWFALIGAVGLNLMSFVFDNGQIEAFMEADRVLLVGAILYSALLASLFGHTSYYWLIQRLPVSLISVTTLLTALLAVGFSVVLLGDAFTQRFLLGSILTLVGVGIVLLRNAEVAPVPIAVEGALTQVDAKTHHEN